MAPNPSLSPSGERQPIPQGSHPLQPLAGRSTFHERLEAFRRQGELGAERLGFLDLPTGDQVKVSRITAHAERDRRERRSVGLFLLGLLIGSLATGAFVLAARALPGLG